MNSVSILANRVHWTRFVLNYTRLRVNHRMTLTSGAQKNQHTKKTKFKLQTSPFHSQSLPLTCLSLSQEVELSLTLTLSFQACRSVAGTVADCSRRRRCLSLPSVRLRVTQSFSLSGWQTTSQSKDSLFFLGVLVIHMHCTWCYTSKEFCCTKFCHYGSHLEYSLWLFNVF